MRKKPEMITIGKAGNEAKREDFSLKDETGVKWEGQQMETPKETLDTSVEGGEAALIRTFFVKLPPKLKGQAPVSNQQLLDAHRGFILSQLWVDGWEPEFEKSRVTRTGRNVRLIVPAYRQKSATGKGFKHNLYDQPLSLKQVLNG